MNSDFRELLRLLSENKVRYLVIGGYAVSYYAEPRYTKDLDIWVEASSINAKRLIKALSEFGAPVDNLETSDFEKEGLVYVFGVPPNRVDLLNGVKGTPFTSAWKSRNIVNLGDLKVPFISREDLIKVKKKANRAQDREDIRKLLLAGKRNR